MFGAESKTPSVPEVDVKTLHAKIGELTLENDFLAAALGKAMVGPIAASKFRPTVPAIEFRVLDFMRRFCRRRFKAGEVAANHSSFTAIAELFRLRLSADWRIARRRNILRYEREFVAWSVRQ